MLCSIDFGWFDKVGTQKIQCNFNTYTSCTSQKTTVIESCKINKMIIYYRKIIYIYRVREGESRKVADSTRESSWETKIKTNANQLIKLQLVIIHKVYNEIRFVKKKHYLCFTHQRLYNNWLYFTFNKLTHCCDCNYCYSTYRCLCFPSY